MDQRFIVRMTPIMLRPIAGAWTFVSAFITRLPYSYKEHGWEDWLIRL